MEPSIHSPSPAPASAREAKRDGLGVAAEFGEVRAKSAIVAGTLASTLRRPAER